MKIYDVNDQEDIAEALTRSLEEQTNSKVFTMRIVGEKKDTLEAFVVFENKAVLFGKINVELIKGQIACRIRGNWL